jgi:hypothetical protein
MVKLFTNLQETSWTEELIEITVCRLQDAYATLTLIEEDLPRAPENNNPTREPLYLLKGHVQSLHAYLVSHENVAHETLPVFSFLLHLWIIE